MAEFQNVKNRLLLFLNSQNIRKSHFEKVCGMANGYINSIVNSISPTKLEAIAKNYPHLNTSWLMTGEGEMLRKNENVEVNGNNNQVTNHSNNVSIDTNEEILTMLKSYCESLKKKDEQIDRLLTLLEKANKG